MKVAFLVYHDVLDERIIDLLGKLEIDSYIKWENVLGKSHGASPHLGTRTFPGHDSVRLIPFQNEENLNKLISSIQEFNGQVVKKDDEIRIYLMPLERIV
jgi:hypothetical protein